jgi:type I restriction enzyme S subunit
MLNDWKISTWGDEVELRYGKALRGYSSSHGTYRVYGSNGPIGWHDKAIFPGPGVILGRKGAYRGVEFSRGDFFVIDTAYCVHPKTDLDIRWLYYAVKFYRLGEIDDGSPIPSTTRAAVYVKELMVPPPAVQKDIAAVLGSLDNKIDLNRRMNDTLEAMARAVFKSWFVDFDPVHAKAAGKAPAHMDAQTAALFPDAFGDDGLPVGWQAECVGEHFEALKGFSYKGSGLSESGTPLFNLNSIIEGGGYKYSGIKYYNGEIKDKYFVNPGDLLIANTEQGFAHLLIGFSSLIPPSQPRGVFSHHLFKIFPRPRTHLDSIYLHFLLAVSPQGEAIRRFSNGTTVNMLPSDAFDLPKITVPSPGPISAFSELVNPIAKRQDAAVVENQTLAALRDLLLPKLMSGELRLRDAEAAVEAAL